MYEKDYIQNPTTCSCENGKYLASNIDGSVITFDKIIETTKTLQMNFKNAQNKNILLPYHITDNKFKKILITAL